MSKRRKFKGNEHGADVCPECSQRLSDDAMRHFWTGPIIHCNGSRLVWHHRKIDNPHHGHAFYSACWSCGGGLGCDQCAGVVTEVLCRRCVCWGTPEALAEHGAFLNTPEAVRRRGGSLAHPITSYPEHFQRAWQEQCSRDSPELAKLYADYRRELATNAAGAEKRMGSALRAALENIGRPMPFAGDARDE